MIHELKIEPQYYEAVRNNRKTFEIRKNDRDYREGDYLALNELTDSGEQYTGRSILVRVKYIMSDERFCRDGYVVMGFERSGIKTAGTILYEIGQRQDIRKTNLDRLKELSAKDMAGIVMCPIECGAGKINCSKDDTVDCYDCTHKWLTSEFVPEE